MSEIRVPAIPAVVRPDLVIRESKCTPDEPCAWRCGDPAVDKTSLSCRLSELPREMLILDEEQTKLG
jgi:hypothetical protein